VSKESETLRNMSAVPFPTAITNVGQSRPPESAFQQRQPRILYANPTGVGGKPAEGWAMRNDLGILIRLGIVLPAGKVDGREPSLEGSCVPTA
jgi:hypothetical protein